MGAERAEGEGKLKRTLGIASLTFYGLGTILGAGIYSVIGVAAGRAREGLWLSFLLSGVVALLTASSYAALAVRFPKTGAEFTYVREGFPRYPSLAVVTGLLVAISGAATAATVAVAFGGYLSTWLEVSPLWPAIGLIVIATGINLVGVRESAWLNAVFTLIEAAGLVAVIAFGATSPRFGAVFAKMSSLDLGGVASATALAFFSFLGFEGIANLAEEAKKPERDLPRAIFLSLGLATAFYVLVAVAAVALVSPEVLATSDAPLADVVRARFPGAVGALSGVALFSTANTALVSVLVASRMIFGMARAEELPRPLSSVLASRKTPWAALLLIAFAALALVPFGDLGFSAGLSSFAALLAFAAVNASRIALRLAEARIDSGFPNFLALRKIPVLPALAFATTLALASQLDRAALVAGGMATACFGLYAAMRRRRVPGPSVTA